MKIGKVANFGMGNSIQLWESLSKLTKSSLIIHITMTCCHFGIKRSLPRAVANILLHHHSVMVTHFKCKLLQALYIACCQMGGAKKILLSYFLISYRW